jgi:hypothetical protein
MAARSTLYVELFKAMAGVELVHYRLHSPICSAGGCKSCSTRSPALPHLPAGGVVSGGVVLADQERSASWIERHAKFGAAAPAAVLEEVRAKIAALIDIE